MNTGNALPFLAGIALLLLHTTAAAALPAPEITGGSAIVVDALSGKVLHQKAADQRRPVASTQKILTALLVVDRGELETPVEITAADAAVEPTKVGVRAGDVYTRRQLLEGLLVKSGNDTALALARDHSGSIEAFSAQMNRRAWELGALNTRFHNPNGLPHEEQFSTARDLAVIARAVYANPTLRAIMALKKIDFQYANGTVREFRNTNRVLHHWPPCTGMKTGYTRASGHCLVTSGTWEGREVITVVLGSNAKFIWSDSAGLLRWALGDKEQ